MHLNKAFGVPKTTFNGFGSQGGNKQFGNSTNTNGLFMNSQNKPKPGNLFSNSNMMGKPMMGSNPMGLRGNSLNSGGIFGQTTQNQPTTGMFGGSVNSTSFNWLFNIFWRAFASQN